MLVSDRAMALEIVKALSDEYSRKIVLSVISKSLPIEEISRVQHIPISTCYRRIRELESYGIIKADKTIIENDGKKFVCYKAAFKSALINVDSGELKVDLIPNKDASDKLHAMWTSVRGADSTPRAQKTPVQEEKKASEASLVTT